MDAPTTIAMIRDLVIVITGVLVIILLLVGAIFTWQVFRALKRAAHNVEQASSLLLGFASQSPSIFAIVKSLVSRGVGFINRDQS